MTIEKIKLNATALLKPFKYHDEMKDTLRSMIETSYHEQIKFEDNMYGDELHKTDWSRYPDFNREWVQYLVPKLHEHFLTCADELNYQGVEVKGMCINIIEKIVCITGIFMVKITQVFII